MQERLGALCSVEVLIDKWLESRRCSRGQLALDSSGGWARWVERSLEAVVPVRSPDVRGQGSTVDGLEHGVVEPGKRQPVGDPVGDICSASPIARQHPLRIDWGDPHDVHDTPSLDSAGGLVDARVGPVHEPVGESGSVEWRVEDDHGEFGERVSSVLPGDCPSEVGAEQWRECVEHDDGGSLIGSGDRREAAGEVVRAFLVLSMIADGVDDVVEGGEVDAPLVGEAVAGDSSVVGFDVPEEVHGILLALVAVDGESEMRVPEKVPVLLPIKVPIGVGDSRSRSGGWA